MKIAGRVARGLVSYGIAAAGLYWVLHDVNFGELLRSLEKVTWWLLIPSILCNLMVYICAGWEWRILLRSCRQPSLGRATQAVFAGRFANDILPVHIGYIVRVFLVSRWTNRPVASVVPSLLVERLFDGLWLALGIGLTALFIPLPPEIRKVAEIWAGIIGLGLVAGVFIFFGRTRRQKKEPQGLFRWSWVRKVEAFVTRVLAEVRQIGRSWFVLGALGISLIKLAFQCFAFLCLLWAYGFEFSVAEQLAIFLIAYVGLSMPSTPASVGVFQVFCVAGLRHFHTPPSAAAGFALLAFVVLTLPLSVAGFFALAQSGFTLTQVRQEAGKMKWSGST